MYKFSKRSISVLDTVDGRLQALAYAVLDNSPFDFGIPSTGGLRTPEEQNALFKKGWSKLDGYTKKSYHQSGNALDIALYDEHGLCYKCKDKYGEVAELFKTYFELLKDIGVFPKESTITWGGNWQNFTDLPHFQINNM